MVESLCTRQVLLTSNHIAKTLSSIMLLCSAIYAIEKNQRSHRWYEKVSFMALKKGNL